jgi:tetratricopeptide (TPR) repeat protein
MIETLQQSVSSLVAQGLHFHQRGDLTQAEQIYRAILMREPRNADALHLMGSLRGRQGLTDEGIRLMEQAIASSPRVSIYHNNVGNLKAASGDTAGAEESYRRAIKLDRKNAEAHLNLGKLLERRAQTAKARECYIACIRLAPRSLEAHMLLGMLEESERRLRAALQSYSNAVHIDSNYEPGHLAMGNVQVKLGAIDKAEVSFRSAIAVNPYYADGLFNLAHHLQTQGKSAEAVEFYRRAIGLSDRSDAEVYNNYGLALSELKLNAEAEEAFRKAIELRPEFDDAYFNLGRALTTYGDTEIGIAMLRKAIEINPGNASAYLQLGTALHARGFLQEAIAADRKSLELDASCQIARKNLGLVLAASGETEGLDILEAMVRERPESPDLHWTWALCLLLHGRHDEGWREYEWRIHVDEMRSQHRKFDVPRWTGERLTGERVLLYTEQGFGDALQFARYALLAAAKGATVVLEVQPGLKRWCSALPGVTQCVAQGETPPEFEMFAPLMSLPYILGTGNKIPLPVAPLFEYGPPDRESGGTKLRVGLVWAGNPKHVLDRLRSTMLLEWSGLAKISGVEFASLQVGEPATQIDTADHGFEFVVDNRGVSDFGQTAAVIAGLDLVITVDTAVAHLAGSMGKPVWILLYNVVDWRWGLEADRTAWYPSARLFRLKTPGDWSGVFAEVEDSLRKLVDGPGNSCTGT